jgi:hypothetical protein
MQSHAVHGGILDAGSFKRLLLNPGCIFVLNLKEVREPLD